MAKKIQLATICYIDNGQELLLLHRNKKANDVHEGKWISVGGKIEAGETPQACAIREIYEETGLTVEEMRFAGMVTFPDFTPDTDWYTYVFKITAFSGQLIDCNEGTLAWVPYQEVMKKPTWAGDYQLFDWILRDVPFFSARFVYDSHQTLLEQDVDFYPQT